MRAQHWIGLSAGAGPAWTLDTIGIASPKTGAAGGIGFTYQFQYSRFILETGLGAALSSCAVGVQDSVWRYAMVDTRGQAFVCSLATEQRTDIARSVALTVPLLAGAEYGRFYGLAGLRLHLHMLTRTRQQALVRTIGEYDIYYEPLEDVPTHGFREQETCITRGTMRYRTDLRAVLELGAVFRSPAGSPKYRVGAYVEYGFLNIRPSSPTSALPLAEPDISSMSVTMHHIYVSDISPASPVHPLSCGIRFTVLFSVGDVPVRYFSPYLSRYRRHRHSCPCLRN